MKSLISYLFDAKKQPKEILWFRNALYFFVLFKALSYCYHFDLLFSEANIIFHQSRQIGFLDDLAFFLTNHYSSGLSLGVIFSIITCGILGLFKKSNYLSNFVLWLLVVNTNNFLYPSLTSGDHLLNQLLFFNIFFSFKETTSGLWNDIKTAFHNSALLAIKIQVCLAYLLAVFYKLMDDDWLHGTAVFYTFQIDEYSNTFLSSIPKILCCFMTYLVLFYQLIFPIVIWNSRFKIYLLGLGIIQHLIIAFGMGLFSFGWIMIICYILFLKYDYK